MTTLFTAENLTGMLGKTVTPERAAAVEGVVWGWITRHTSLTERPDPVPPALFSAALELGAIAHENPAGADEKAAGPFSVKYGADRRAEILAELERSEWGTATSQPSGEFPLPWDYPDPAERWP